jgi:prephenate dehydratase
MTHPQVFSQCKTTLEQNIRVLSNLGKENSSISACHETVEQKNPKHISDGGSILADIYGLTIIEDQLQDMRKLYQLLLVEHVLYNTI